MQFNLNTVSYGNSTLSGAYPTKNNVDAALEMMRRTGATNVIGVGSGAAIDLAKACYYKSREEGDSSVHDGADLILNPSTLGAILSATSKDCLTLCSDEEALLPYYSTHADADATTVVVDDNAITVPSWVVSNDVSQLRNQRGNNATIIDSALASLVIALDAAHSLGAVLDDDSDMKSHYSALLHECITSSLICVNTMKEDGPASIQSSQKHAINSMLNAGQLLSFGNGSNTGASSVAPLMRRNISLAMTSAILPQYFPHGNWTVFTASLLPGLCYAIEEQSDEAEDNALLRQAIASLTGNEESSVSFSHLTEWVDKITSDNNGISIPSLSSLAEGAPDFSELVNHVEDNGAFLNCIDADSSFMETLLVTSLNR